MADDNEVKRIVDENERQRGHIRRDTTLPATTQDETNLIHRVEHLESQIVKMTELIGTLTDKLLAAAQTNTDTGIGDTWQCNNCGKTFPICEGHAHDCVGESK